MRTTDFGTLLYSTVGPVATITLNRPEALNTIVPPMPDEIEAAVGLAERDPKVKVIVLRGAGRSRRRRGDERRDGPFGDYSQAPPELRPDPSHIITP